MLSRSIRAASVVRSTLSQQSVKSVLAAQTVRCYGVYEREVMDLLNHARAGNFGTSRESIDDCEICQTYPGDTVRSNVVKIMLNPWDKQWMSMYEQDHISEHDEDILEAVGKRMQQNNI